MHPPVPQTLAFVNVQLFNQLLLRPDCCCTSNARYMVAGLQLLEGWLAAPTTPCDGAQQPQPHEGPAGGHEELSVLAGDLRHIRQVRHMTFSNFAAPSVCIQQETSSVQFWLI